jgi:hypothetical protein
MKQPVGLTAVQQRENMRMLQTGCGADLAQEALAAEGGAEVRMEHLDRDVAVVLQIVREVHGGHAAGAEFPVESLALREGAGQPVSDVAHAISTCGEWPMIV